MDDFFRSSANGLESHPGNRRFLGALFEAPCRRLGVTTRDVFGDSGEGGVPVGALMDRLGLERSTIGWAAATVAKLDRVLDGEFSLHLGPRSLVIGWGLPPSLLHLIADSGAAFIDIEVDSLRFARHLRLCARTNDSQILEILRSLEVPKEVFWSSASTIRAYFARNGSADLVSRDCRVGLFAGQTEVDLALVRDGRLVTPVDCVSEIARLAEEVDVLLFKRHPYSSNATLLSDIAAQIPNAALVDHNIYGMFTARNLEFVCALSSGALKECEFFGVAGRALITPDRGAPRQLPAACSPWITVPADVGSIGAVERGLRKMRFWQRLVKCKVEPTFDPDALDGIFGVRWGFDSSSPGLPECRLLAPDGRYRFGLGGEGAGWLATGWHGAESWGAWSSADICRLILPLDASALQGRALRMAFHGVAFASARITRIEIDGEGLIPVRETEENSVVYSVEIAGSRFAGQVRSLISVHVEGGARPIDVSEGPDLRRLGFGLSELRVSAVPDMGMPPAPAGEGQVRLPMG